MKKIILVVALLPLVLLMLSSASAQVTVDNTVLFKLAAHGTYMNFDENITVSEITIRAENATFENIVMGDNSVSSWTVSIENANATVRSLEENLEINLEAGTGAKSLITTTLTMGPFRVKLNGVIISSVDSLDDLHASDSGWYYSGGVAYVKTTHASANLVMLGLGNILPTASPTISPTNPAISTTLTCTPNASDVDGDSVTVAYQWYNNNSPIGGATSSTYIILQVGEYKCGVTPNDGIGNGGMSFSDAVVVAAAVDNEDSYFDELMRGEWFGAITGPYTAIIGSFFYIIVFLLGPTLIAIKYQNLAPVAMVIFITGIPFAMLFETPIQFFFAVASILGFAGILYSIVHK